MLDSSPKDVMYNSLKRSSSVWLAQLESALWTSIQAEYLIEEALDIMEDALDEVLETLDLPLGTPICISLEITLDFTELNMAKVEEIMFEFAISLLGAIIQDGGMRERSNFVQNLSKLSLILS